jgi:hypothetical protein
MLATMQRRCDATGRPIVLSKGSPSSRYILPFFKKKVELVYSYIDEQEEEEEGGAFTLSMNPVLNTQCGSWPRKVRPEINDARHQEPSSDVEAGLASKRGRAL